MSKHIIDGMKKEGKKILPLMILGYAFSWLAFLLLLTNDDEYTKKDIILYVISFFIIGSIGLYFWLYSFKYILEISDKKIRLKTLFKKIEVNFIDIISYTCNRYRRSVFYQFRLNVKDKIILVNTRYKDEFIELLKNNNIKEDNNK